MKNRLIKKTKKAFSMIELIFVLVILGIVASISSQIIVQVYENYIMQRAIYNVSTKTELVANQIVNRLTYRIQGSTTSKNHDRFDASHAATAIGLPLVNDINDSDWIPLSDLTSGTFFNTLEWIGYDNDSFSSTQNPNWSGISDYEPATASINGFNSPGSNLNNVAIIMNNLSGGEVDLSNANPAAIVFSQNSDYYDQNNQYSQLCMGLIPEHAASSTACIFRVQQNTPNSFTFLDAKPKIITERYKLAWSAYAIVPEDPDGDGLNDLFLYSNYQPWNLDPLTGNPESYLDATTTKNLLMPNVTVFKFSETGGVIRFKLCAAENIGEDFNVTTCKEKVVIR